MIYKSIENIPSRLFFKIAETGDLTLLNTKEVKEVKELTEDYLKKLNDVWIDLQEQDSKLSDSKKHNDLIDVLARIERIKLNQEKVKGAINILEIDNDDVEMRVFLEKQGYKITKDFKDSISRIKRYNDAKTIKISRLEVTLPKQNESTGSTTPFAKRVIAYSAFVNGGSHKPNTITQEEYRVLQSLFIEKLKAVENGKGANKG